MGSARELSSVIAAEFDEEWYRDDLASLVGERSNDELAAWISRLCVERLGHRCDAAFFARKSVGAVFGLQLSNGRRAVLKVFSRHLDEPMLLTVERCLARAHSAGYPCPAQLTPLFTADGVYAAFYELSAGEVLDAHAPEIRLALASSLARLVEILADVNPRPLPIGPAGGATLWEPPHRATIDLTVAGGEWIDAYAREAQAVIREARLKPICAHYDWNTKNALFLAGRLHAVLDWDSLKQASEAEMIGRAAGGFTAHDHLPVPHLPSCDEASAFMQEYERARNRSFSNGERRVAEASIQYLIAQVARHGVTGPDCSDDEYRTRLRGLRGAPLICWS